MSKVPCACPACNGRLVTKYIRRNHMRAFVALNHDATTSYTGMGMENDCQVAI